MDSSKSHNLWGKDFRIVPSGLAETDVVDFVEKLMKEHRESLKQLDHLGALRELASMTVEEAEELASTITEDARRKADEAAAKTIAKAKEEARKILERAERALREQTETVARMRRGAAEADALKEALRQGIATIESSLAALTESARRELSGRMPSHYIGKHLHQSVHFLAAFEDLIREVQAESARDEGARAPGPDQKPLPKRRARPQ